MRTHSGGVHEKTRDGLMRLLYPDPHPVPDDCPESMQILHTADALGKIGVETTVVTPPRTRPVEVRDILGRELSANVSLQHLGSSFHRWLPVRTNRLFYRSVIRSLRPSGVDAILVRNLKMAERLLRRAPAVPLFFETHELFAQSYREEHREPSWRERRKLAALTRREEFVYRRARGLLVLTPLLLEDIRSAYGVDTPAVVVPDGVDLEMTGTLDTAPPRNDPPVLLYLGSLHPWKGIDTLIEAMVHLKQPARLRIVGGNDRRIAELQAHAGRLGVADRVEFSGPCLPGKRYEIIQQADICLLPLAPTSIGSRYTSPLKLFEYLALGKPVVVSNLPSMRAVLEDGTHALMAASGEPAAFAAAIGRLLANPSLRLQLGQAARAHARNFGWTQRAISIRDFLAGELAHEPHKPTASEIAETES
ncbi:MAG: glycosyltransferase family 4 protein [Gammaproteobacteria bacterium]|nr:glycosyltransferase family 4 protein [Gammaproteobacteria bacterium]